MQKDTRLLTVARAHLDAARRELRLALDSTDIHLQQSAVRRLLDHLQLARSRLLEQRERVGRETDAAVHAAFEHGSRAVDRTFALLRDWPGNPSAALDALREAVSAAQEEIDRATEIGRRREQMHR